MKIIVGNWKMNGNTRAKETMLRALKNLKTNNKVILCLPFTLLNGTDYGIDIGAQDISQHENGAFTGDISGEMLSDAGVKYVIVGHSERRLYHHETNEIVKQKAIASIKNNLIPIICVGESLLEKQSGQTNTAIKKMLSESIPNSGKYIIAYEPIWAIGTGQTPTTDEIVAVHEMIFKTLRENNKKSIPIIYGGSVNPNNASDISGLPNVDGLLVGGASLKTETFLPIINSVK